MVKRKNRLTTDAVREVRNTFSRFLSILVLSALAVAFLSGLRATAPDMKYTADNYFDRTHMMDGYAISTLGITNEDLEALAAAEGVEEVEGVRTVDVTATDHIVSIRSMPEKLNLLEVEEGRLPQAADECVTDHLLLAELGLEIGDTLTVTLEEDDQDTLVRTSYTVVGTVICPLYAGADRGTTSLGDGSLDGVVFVPGENFTTDYYSIAYLTGTGLAALDSYSDEYDDAAEALLDRLESLGDQRAQLRYDQVVGDAQADLDDAQTELDDARTEAETQLADAQAELQDARAQLDKGWRDYKNGQTTLTQEINSGRAELSSTAQTLNNAQAEYDAGLAQYNAGLEEYEAGLAQYKQNAASLDTRQAELDEAYAQYQAALAPYVGTPYYDEALAQMAPQKAQLDETQAQLDAGRQQLAESKAQLDAVKGELDASKAQLDEAQASITSGWADYNSGTARLNKAEKEGRAELASALSELQQGEADYTSGQADYQEGKAEADQEIADAQAKLDDARAQVDEIDQCEWYVLGRSTNSGFVGYSQDSERVSNLASIFPIIFFLVAALACLTTMTRMVEEQRTQIGALK
ncbi:MAG: hypothetical protein ACI3VS_03170, partial [Evtepia sp.]